MADLRLPDLNKVLICGRLTRDPELRHLPSGQAKCSLSIANTSYYRKQDGSRAESTAFVDVEVWNKQAEWVGERLRKGRPVLVEGTLKSDSWEDKNTGQKRTKIIVSAQRITPLDWDDADRGGGGGGYSRGAGAAAGASSGAASGGGYDRGGSGGGGRNDDYDDAPPEDDIPF